MSWRTEGSSTPSAPTNCPTTSRSCTTISASEPGNNAENREANRKSGRYGHEDDGIGDGTRRRDARGGSRERAAFRRCAAYRRDERPVGPLRRHQRPGLGDRGAHGPRGERKSGGVGKSVARRVDRSGRRITRQKNIEIAAINTLN